MRILFTGGSSFTGMWFVHELKRAGHEVVATFQRRDREAYQDRRLVRVQETLEYAEPVYDCAFGSDRFMETLANTRPFDAICHHAADVTDYKSPDFNVLRAVTNNTHNIRSVLTEMLNHGCTRFLSTASVFSPGEGAGSQNLPAVSPYGLSKGFTNDLIAHYASSLDVSLGKFVIPNPFGPHEEPRFTNYLVKMWYDGRTPEIQTPDYVRDNIHVSLLAKAYVKFLESLPNSSGTCSINPTGYIESQGTFAARFAKEMEPRLGIPCPVTTALQTDFSEPRIRINTEQLDHAFLGFDESQAWDEIAAFYQTLYTVQTVKA